MECQEISMVVEGHADGRLIYAFVEVRAKPIQGMPGKSRQGGACAWQDGQKSKEIHDSVHSVLVNGLSIIHDTRCKRQGKESDARDFHARRNECMVLKRNLRYFDSLRFFGLGPLVSLHLICRVQHHLHFPFSLFPFPAKSPKRGYRVV